MIKVFGGLGLILGSLLAAPPAMADSDLDGLIQTCKRHEADPQTKPFKTKVFCRGTYTFWEQQGIEGFELRTTFNVYNSASMKGDRYKLRERGYQMPSESDTGDCNVYREMRVDVPSLQIEMNRCSDLEAMAAEGRDAFCERNLNGAPGNEAAPTGRIVSSCDGEGSGGGGGGGGGGSGGGGSSDLGATFESKSFSHNETTYMGVAIKAITNTQGILGTIGLRKGDIIVSVDGSSVASVAVFNKKMDDIKKSGGKFEIVAYQSEINQFFAFRGEL